MKCNENRQARDETKENESSGKRELRWRMESKAHRNSEHEIVDVSVEGVGRLSVRRGQWTFGRSPTIGMRHVMSANYGSLVYC